MAVSSTSQRHSSVANERRWRRVAGATRDTAGTDFKLGEHGWFWEDPVSPKVHSTLG